jgi:hypothetical protein
MFESAKLKIKRAERHISDVEGSFLKFTQDHPHKLSLQTNPTDGQLSIRVKFGDEMPDDIALAIGDAIHNLRTSLDHLVWETVGLDGGTQDRYLKLPTGNNRVNFESSCQGIVTPSQSIKDMLKGLEIFPGGTGDDIYALHLLDNADKHTVLMPAIRATNLSKLVILNPDGSTAVTMTDTTLIGGSGPFANVASVPPGMSVELDDETYATPDIFFEKVEGAPVDPVIPTLRRFRYLCAETVEIFETNLSNSE